MMRNRQLRCAALLGLLLCGCAAGEGGVPRPGDAPAFPVTPSVLCSASAPCPISEPFPASELLSSSEPDSVTESVLSPEQTELSGDVTLSFVGDVMLASENGDDGFWTFNLFAYDTPKDYYFEKMQDLFAADDFTVANCENVFTDRDLAPREKPGADEGLAFWYRSGTENAEIFSAGNIEIVSLANNHALDYGAAGRNDTAAALEAAGCTCVTDGDGLILEKNGLRIGIFFVNLPSEYWMQPVYDWLEDVKPRTDYRIVYYHGGSERTHVPDAWRIRASRAMVDAGADLVLGSHPHVLQPTETYQGKTIVYSLGNFLFGGSHTCENRTVVFRLTLSSENGSLSGTKEEFIPCRCYGELWQPVPLEETGEAYRLVQDFLRGEREKPF